MPRNCTLRLKLSNEPEPRLIIAAGITRCRIWMHSEKMKLWRQGYQIVPGTENSLSLTLGDLTAELYIEEEGKRL